MVGGHQRSGQVVDVADPRFAVPRRSSNVGPRIDISAAACPNPPESTVGWAGRGVGCGTSYAAALVTGVVAAMISIKPDLTPLQIKGLLRQSALPMVARADQASRIGPTRPIRAVACLNNGACTLEQFARMDMYQALALEAGFVVQDERLAPRLGLTLSRRVADIVAIDRVITQG